MLSGTLRWARPADAAARYYADGFALLTRNGSGPWLPGIGLSRESRDTRKEPLDPEEGF